MCVVILTIFLNKKNMLKIIRLKRAYFVNSLYNHVYKIKNFNDYEDIYNIKI